MSQYEALTRIRLGKKKRAAAGETIAVPGDISDAEAKRLAAIGALRVVRDIRTEADGEPVGTAQRAMAAATANEDAKLNFVTATAELRKELSGKSHKQLDKIIEDDGVGEIESENSKPTIAEKVEGIVAFRSNKLLGVMNRGALLDVAAASGYADLAALELAEDAAEDTIRASLMRVAAAKADG